jgi:hypothetical protein
MGKQILGKTQTSNKTKIRSPDLEFVHVDTKTDGDYDFTGALLQLFIEYVKSMKI